MIGLFDQDMMNNKFGLIELKSSYVSVKVKELEIDAYFRKIKIGLKVKNFQMKFI